MYQNRCGRCEEYMSDYQRFGVCTKCVRVVLRSWFKAYPPVDAVSK